MLATHLNNYESLLLCQTTIPAVGGHSLHLGTPREVFIRDFLANHLPSDLAIGTGEIIDRNSGPSQPRHQHDIILYRPSYPRIYLGGGISAFLNESVVATIEVKSTLDEADITQAVGAGLAIRSLTRSFAAGSVRPISNFVVAYAGPAQMSTVFNWIRNEYTSRNLSDPHFFPPINPRNMVDSTALNGIFLMGKGTCLFENGVGYIPTDPNHAWSISSAERGSLALFFAVLIDLSISSQQPVLFSPWPYFSGHQPTAITFNRIDTPPAELT